MRVADYLSESHVVYETMVHPPVFTAQRRAHLLHIPGKRVIKAVLLFVAAAVLTTWVLGFVGFDISALFGRLYGVKTLLDASIDPEAWIVFEAERHFMTIRMRCRDFEALEQPERFPFAVV